MTDNPSIEGGAYITAPDYAKVLLMHMHGGKCGHARVLSEQAVATMRTDRVAAYGGDPDPNNHRFIGYGLGWWLAEGYIADGGLYGAIPVINKDGEIGVVLLLEASDAAGAQIMQEVQPVLAETAGW